MKLEAEAKHISLISMNITHNLLQAKSLATAQNKTKDTIGKAKSLAQYTEKEMEEVVDGIMKHLDRPENDTAMRRIISEIKGIEKWHG